MNIPSTLQPEINEHAQKITQQEIDILLSEVIPGITHKTNNLLMHISGSAKLAELRSESPQEVKRMIASLTQSCNLLKQLLDKLVVLAVHDQDLSHSVNSIGHCLSSVFAMFSDETQAHFLGKEDIYPCHYPVVGEGKRLEAALQFLIRFIESSVIPTYRVKMSMDFDAPPCCTHPMNQKKYWIHITFDIPFCSEMIDDPQNDFYKPDKPFQLSSSFLAAAEHIICIFGGKILIEKEPNDQIHLYLVQRCKN